MFLDPLEQFLYVAENTICTVRRINLQTNQVTTLIGPTCGTGINKCNHNVESVIVDYSGALILIGGNAISRATLIGNSTTSYMVELIAGDYVLSGYTDGSALTSRFSGLSSAVLRNNELFALDRGNNMIRKLTPQCFGLYYPDAYLCNGRGTCVAPDTCLCYTSFTGTKCENQQARIK